MGRQFGLPGNGALTTNAKEVIHGYEEHQSDPEGPDPERHRGYQQTPVQQQHLSDAGWDRDVALGDGPAPPELPRCDWRDCDSRSAMARDGPGGEAACREGSGVTLGDQDV